MISGEISAGLVIGIVLIVIVLIIVEAGFLILRRFAPDSAISIQLEKFFMHIADVIYSHFG